MNNDEEFRATPRWAQASPQPPPTAAELAVLGRMLRAMRSVQFGAVQVVIQDGLTVMVETTEKLRI